MPSLIDLLKQQNFGPNDSMIASAAMHPLEALLKSKQWFDEQVNTGMGMPRQPTDEGDIYAQAPLDLARLLASTELAGLAEVGSFPSAPKSAGGTLGTLARKADDLPETEFSKAHKIAQKNAALPVEKGGLGLPPNNTAMDRASAMGFDTPVYRGTRSNETIANDLVYTSKNKSTANSFAGWVDDMPEEINKLMIENPIEGGNVMPLLLNSKAGIVNQMHEILDKYQIQPLRGKDVRSIFAAFDPKKKDSANILASLLLGTAFLNQDKDGTQSR